MVVFSLLVIVFSGGLLAAGIISGDDVLVVSSIVLSLIAATVLFVGVWRQRAEQTEADPLKIKDSDDDISERGTALVPESTAHRQEPTPVSKADHAAWARSAVTSIVDEPGDEDTAAIMRDQRPSSVDVATEIPQLMKMGAARQKPAERTNTPPGSAGEAGVQRSQIAQSDASAVEPAPLEVVARAQSQGSHSEAIAGMTVTTETGTGQASVADRSETSSTKADAASDAVASTAQVPPIKTVTEVAAAAEAEEVYPDPPDEPPAELLLSYEERQLSDCDAEVLVVDGRPRFHLAGCLHLGDKETEPLVLSEAAELGFTSCSLCAAATTVLTGRADPSVTKPDGSS